MIAICALRVAEAGVVDLDADFWGQGYSLRHLLHHSSGLRDYGHCPEYHAAVAAEDTPWSRDRLLEVALAKGRMFPPGQGWSYSNIGYMFVREGIEAATGSPLGEVISDMICAPLGLQSVAFAKGPDGFEGLHWEAAARYDPRWVYHGCLTGTAEDAARLLHALFAGGLLSPAMRAEMLVLRQLGGPLPGRPWSSCAYGLGLMAGTVDGLGQVIGHSGAGPFCVNAVYHFPDLADPITVASFTDGTDEGVAEFEAVRIARDHMGRTG